jgi:hypothetical protein
MKTTNFKTGQKVRIQGLKNEFRYVSKNVVRNIKTGQFLAVNPEKIRELKPFWSEVFSYFKWTILFSITIIIWILVLELIF